MSVARSNTVRLFVSHWFERSLRGHRAGSLHWDVSQLSWKMYANWSYVINLPSSRENCGSNGAHDSLNCELATNFYTHCLSMAGGSRSNDHCTSYVYTSRSSIIGGRDTIRSEIGQELTLKYVGFGTSVQLKIFFLDIKIRCYRKAKFKTRIFNQRAWRFLHWHLSFFDAISYFWLSFSLI